MRNEIIKALEAHFKAGIIKHEVNINVLLSNPIAIPEHSDMIETIEKELEAMVNYQDKLDVLTKYFS